MDHIYKTEAATADTTANPDVLYRNKQTVKTMPSPQHRPASLGLRSLPTMDAAELFAQAGDPVSAVEPEYEIIGDLVAEDKV